MGFSTRRTSYDAKDAMLRVPHLKTADNASGWLVFEARRQRANAT